MVKLYLLKSGEVADTPELYFREHVPERLERAGQFRFEADRLRCLGAGILLSEILGITEEQLCITAEGKLFLPGDERKFNLSHSGDYVVLAVSDREVGVDIEKQDDRHLDVAKRVFQTGELAWMAEDPVKRFFCLWSLKESVMKATGLGFKLPPESFSVLSLLEGDPISVSGKTYRACSPDMVPGYGLSVCLEMQDGDEKPSVPEVFDLKRNNGIFVREPYQN